MKSDLKTIAFVDGGTMRPNIVSHQLNNGTDHKIDWERFLVWLDSLCNGISDCHYYDALPENPTPGLVGFHTFLETQLKFRVHLTRLRNKRKSCPHCAQSYFVDEQKGVDVGVAVDMIELAPHYEQAILVSGDGDFEGVVSRIRQRYARRVIVINWENTIEIGRAHV